MVLLICVPAAIRALWMSSTEDRLKYMGNVDVPVPPRGVASGPLKVRAVLVKV